MPLIGSELNKETGWAALSGSISGICVQGSPLPTSTTSSEETGSRTVFLHVLTAAEGQETNPPGASYRISGRGQIELTVDDVKTNLAVPEWFAWSS